MKRDFLFWRAGLREFGSEEGLLGLEFLKMPLSQRSERGTSLMVLNVLGDLTELCLQSGLRLTWLQDNTDASNISCREVVNVGGPTPSSCLG